MNNTNELLKEKSPYLLQHVNNPVYWYPWSEDAFQKAKIEDKPIFLSIGYSTCHWCHVMAHESFENDEVAKFLNKNYIAIKVDREERPDIDGVYMSVCQALTGSGGWPLSVFIDYDKKPLYAGTYFPRNAFMNLIKKINDLWINERYSLMAHTDKIIQHITDDYLGHQEADVSIADEAYRLLETSFDEEYGGFSRAPKFPTPHNLLFLLKYYQCTKKRASLNMCLRTLDHMREGGIYDHIGYGFSRYSTDRKWLVPHFEKMLYDNVLLIITYAQCYHISKDKRFIETGTQIIEYLLRKMKNDEGGFYTAEDADSEGEEGVFYVFDYAEVKSILKEDADIFCKYFNITEKGNFEGKNIPNLIGKKIDVKDKEVIERCRKKIFEYQNKREHPYKDDKILTSYNGLAIGAFAIMGKLLNNDEYIEIAKETVKFIKENLYVSGKLMARYRDHEVKYLAYDDDYAYLIFGLIELHQSTLDNSYLDFAKELNKIFIDNFYDEKNGGFYQNDKDAETILIRKKEIYDGATPSANSVQVYNLYRLSALTQDTSLSEIADKTLGYFVHTITQYPAAYSFSIINVLYHAYGATDIILSANNKEDIKNMLQIIQECDFPFINISLVNDDKYKMVDNIPTAYICKGFICLPPINDLEKLSEVLRK